MKQASTCVWILSNINKKENLQVSSFNVSNHVIGQCLETDVGASCSHSAG